MAVKQKVVEDFDKLEQVMRWRYNALRDLGLAPDEALALIEKADIVHSASKLAKQGCPPRIIASLLGD